MCGSDFLTCTAPFCCTLPSTVITRFIGTMMQSDFPLPIISPCGANSPPTSAGGNGLSHVHESALVTMPQVEAPDAVGSAHSNAPPLFRLPEQANPVGYHRSYNPIGGNATLKSFGVILIQLNASA